MADGSDCEANPQCSLDEATEGEMAENINYRSSMDSGQTLDKPPPLPEKVPRSCSLPVPAVGEPPLLPPRSRPGPALPLPSPPIQPVTGDTTQSVAGSEASRREQWLSEDQAVAEMTTVQKLSEKPDSLPAVIRFVDGYYGQTSHFSVSAGDHFQMHFLRHSEILEVQDISRRKYAIPLASTMKLGLLLDEFEHTCNPLSMAGVLAIKKLPQVLYAVTDVLGKKGREVVREGDILIAKEKTHKALKCLNLTTKSDVLLEKSFTGKFTLDSEATMMYPREIVQHLPAVLPCKARVFDQTGTSKGPMGLGGKVITLLGANTEICLVANEVRPGSRAGDGVNIINFPVDGTLGSLRVEVLDVEDKKLLCDDACKVFQNFDPSSAITYANVGTDTAFDIQNTLYQELCSDQDPAELVISEALKNASEKDKVTQVDKDSKTEEKKEMKRPTDAVHQSMAESESDSDEYDVIDPALFSESLPPPKPRAATAPLIPPPLPQNKPKRPVRLTPQCTTDSESSDHYSTITDTDLQLRSSPKPAVKPRLPENKPKRPARPTSQFTTESESSADHYSTITDTKAQLRSRPKPAVKPRPGSAARKQAISDTTHHLSQSQSPTAPGPGSGYTTLIPPQWRQEPYSTVGPLPAQQCPPVVPGSHQTKVKNEPFLKDIGLDPRPLSAPEGPPIVPRRNTPDSHQLSQITELRLTREKNKAFLKEMSPAQVLQMLDALKLSQYRERFEEEVIAGDILVECDELTLENELGVGMRIHRLKLLQIIRGLDPRPLPAPQCPPVVPGSQEPFLKDIGLDPQPLPAPEGPPVVPRRNTPDSHQLSQITELRLTREKNKAFLKEMSPAQVLQMLDALKLSQYRERFEEEVIAGNILVECDELTLENELGVGMRIHRLKLLQIIRGDTSARPLVNPE